MSEQFQTYQFNAVAQTQSSQAQSPWPSGMIGTEQKKSKKSTFFKEGYPGILGGGSKDAHPWKTKRRGLGLAELLIALAISALLLTAAAAALDSSFKAYAINQENSTLMQSARVAMNRITTTIRLSDIHAPYNSTPLSSFSVGTTVTDTGISMYDEADNLITFKYDSANKQVLCVTGTTEHVMLQGVEQFDIVMEPMRSAGAVKTAGAYDLLRRAVITIGVKTNANTAGVGESTGQQLVTLSAAVAPRKNAW